MNVQTQLKHLLTIEDLTPAQLLSILDKAKTFFDKNQRIIKQPLLKDKTVTHVFFEPSTRTRTTFEQAARYLSADVISLDIQTSSTSKGESLLDTIRTLEAMQTDIFVIRHSESGVPELIAKKVESHVSVVNAGDGQHAHPTQALLDMFTIRHHKPNFEELSVAIVGDILHSRVARSQIQALRLLGVHDIRIIAPQSLLPNETEMQELNVFQDIDQGLQEVDVIIGLRLQRERMQSALIPNEEEYYRNYGITEERVALAKPDAIVMHPGPINRDVEIQSSVADGKQSVILQQVHFGLAVRMAVFSLLIQ